MNVLALSTLVTGILFIAMASFVYFTNRSNRVSRLWAVFCLVVSTLGFGAFLIGITAYDAQLALIWWRVIHVSLIPIPVLFYHFVTVFTEIRRPKTLTVLCVAGAAFLMADATPFFVGHMRPVFGQFYYLSQPSPLYTAFQVFFFGTIILSHVEVFRCMRRTSQRDRYLLYRSFFIGAAMGFVGGGTCVLPIYGIDLYPSGFIAAALFPVFMTYAFLRYRLIDLNVAVARGVAFFLMYVCMVGLPFLVGYALRPLWQAVLGEWWWAAPVVLMGVLASASPVLFILFSRRLEQQLWQAQGRYHRTLITASSGMTQIKDIRQLCSVIVHMVNRTVGLTNTCLFLYDPKEPRYALQAVRYPSLVPATVVVEPHAPLIQLLQEDKDLLGVEALQRAVESRHADERVKWTYAWMRTLDARLIVPSFSGDRLLAFLVLGSKRSGESYTADDITIFSGLANQAALAIENAMFMDELKTSEAYMIQSEKLASLGQMASGMAHEIHNPLTIISGESQLYLERFKGTDDKVDKLLRSIIEECQRAADITRRILRFAKPAPPEVTPVDLKAVVEESLTLAGYQVRLDRVERDIQVSETLPKVCSNQNQLQEVILNLILNACQAMGEKGGKLLFAAQPNGSFITLTVSDTGPGISASNLRKIFNPFFTTKPTGTGLGLFVSQRIIKSHGGTIELASEEGKGTCFTIRLPVWKEGTAGTPPGDADGLGG